MSHTVTVLPNLNQLEQREAETSETLLLDSDIADELLSQMRYFFIVEWVKPGETPLGHREIWVETYPEYALVHFANRMILENCFAIPEHWNIFCTVMSERINLPLFYRVHRDAVH